ncbi:MAG: hypothetical protein N3A38_04470 [Planctomycetota bacterium]|nr:hypothetical protein [Planctomycetota bacterium]
MPPLAAPFAAVAGAMPRSRAAPAAAATTIAIAVFCFTAAPGGPAAGAEPAGPGIDPYPAVPEYPGEMRRLRRTQLNMEGMLAPDTAYAVQKCPACGATFLKGIYPVTSRRPWNSLRQVPGALAEGILRAPPDARPGAVRRPCPSCKAVPEGKPDRVAFYRFLHRIGEDLEIEFAAEGEALVWKSFSLIPPKGEVRRFDPPADEDAFRAAFGCHFSLREVWKNLAEKGMGGAEVLTREIESGHVFFLRPPGVKEDDRLKALARHFIELARTEGFDSVTMLTALDPPGGRIQVPGTYAYWIGPKAAPLLASGDMDAFVAVRSRDFCAEAAKVAESLSMKITFRSEEDKKSGRKLLYYRLQSGDYAAEYPAAEILIQSACAGVELAHGFSLFGARSLIEVDSARKLSDFLRRRLSQCRFSVEDGRFLVIRDIADRTVRLNMLSVGRVARRMPEAEMEKFLNFLVPFDEKNGRLGPDRPRYMLCECGLPVTFHWRIRPAGFLKGRGAEGAIKAPGPPPVAGTEICCTAECPDHVVYVDLKAPRFEGLDEARAGDMAGKAPGWLPWIIEASEVSPLGEKYVHMACGAELASVLADPAVASALALNLGLRPAGPLLHGYVGGCNEILFCEKPLSVFEQEKADGLLRALSISRFVERGPVISKAFAVPWTTPKGRFVRDE